MNELTMGKRIAEQRKKIGLTQAKLAEKLYVSNKAVSKWESDSGFPSLDLIPKLCELFNCSSDYLLGIKEKDKETDLQDKKIVVPIGIDERLNVVMKELEEIKNALVVGNSGMGKSYFLCKYIKELSIKTKKDQLKLALIDCKKTEFEPFCKNKNLYEPIAFNQEDAISLIAKIAREINIRLEEIKKSGVDDIQAYNKVVKGKNKFPYIILIIDELSLIMTKKDSVVINLVIKKILEYSTKVGIYVTLCTRDIDGEIISKSIIKTIDTLICFDLPHDVSIEYVGSDAAVNLSEGKFIFSSKSGKCDKLGVYNSIIENSKKDWIYGGHMSPLGF